MRTPTVLGLAAAACLLVLTACGGSSDSSADESTSESAGTVVNGVPEVVAEVNGEQVTREEFTPVYEAQLEQAKSDQEAGGEKPDRKALKEQSANNLIDAELLAQEAESRGIEVSEEDIEEELTSLAESYSLGSGQELIDALAEQGTTEEETRSQVELQVMVEKLVADEEGPFDPTEKELKELYSELKAQALSEAEASGEQTDIPPFNQVRDEVLEQADSNHVTEVAQEMVDELREDADITIHL